MYERKELGTEECLKAVHAMIRKAQEDGGAPIAVAVVDTHGELICYARMDGYPVVSRHQACNEVANHMCIKKAYTASMWGRDTREFSERQGETAQNIGPKLNIAVDFSSAYTTTRGGVAVVEPGKQVVYGGIGVGGRTAEEDDDIALVGLKTIQNELWPSAKSP
jgi:glc operon protein GlcG